MERLKQRAMQMARRATKGVAALALHYSGARELLSTVQRRAVGGRRVLILSYHRVVADYAEEAGRSLYEIVGHLGDQGRISRNGDQARSGDALAAVEGNETGCGKTPSR